MLSAVVLCAGLTGVAQTPKTWQVDPAFQKAKAEAQQLAKRRGSERWALDGWEKANKIAGGQCAECRQQMYHLALKLGDDKRAVREAEQLEAMVTLPADKGTAAFLRGRALMAEAGEEKPKTQLLEEAHGAFVDAVAKNPKLTMSYFQDGRALAWLNRNVEATEAFGKYAASAPADDALALRAQHFAENPELARHRQAPPIQVTTLSGKHFSLDEMGGRVVLVDFWATWCGPCNAELPHMQKLAAKYANDPFEIVSISWDSDEAKWKEFIDAHHMTWDQYRDADHELSTAFGVNAIPHYFTIDSDGVLTAENVGSGSMADGRIDKLVKRARESVHRETASEPKLQ